eukprot:3766493-Rhodomonas_salina.2
MTPPEQNRRKTYPERGFEGGDDDGGERHPENHAVDASPHVICDLQYRVFHVISALDRKERGCKVGGRDT